MSVPHGVRDFGSHLRNFPTTICQEKKEGPATHAEGTARAKARRSKEHGADWRPEEGAEGQWGRRGRTVQARGKSPWEAAQ